MPVACSFLYCKPQPFKTDKVRGTCAPSGSWVHSLHKSRHILSFRLLSKYEISWKSGEELWWYLKTKPKNMAQKSSCWFCWKSKHLPSFRCKGKGHPRTGHEGPEGGVEVWLYSFFNLGARLGWLINITPTSALLLGKGFCAHWTGGWVGPRAGLDGCGSRHTSGFVSRAVHPVASRYTDCTIPAHTVCSIRVGCRKKKWI